MTETTTNTSSPVTAEMIEAVARAIADKRNELIGLPPAFWSDGEWNKVDLVLTPNDRDRYRAEATAAILAMHTLSPTDRWHDTLTRRVKSMRDEVPNDSPGFQTGYQEALDRVLVAMCPEVIIPEAASPKGEQHDR